MDSPQEQKAYDMFYSAILRHCKPPAEEWEFYRDNMKLKSFKKGDFLVRPGDPQFIYAYVISGIFKQYFITHQGREFITRFDVPEQTSGDAASLWRNIPARQYIEAITDVEALVSTHNLLPRLRARHPVWHEGGRSLAEFRFFEKCDREYELLSYSAEERYQNFLKAYPLHFHLIPQKDIANFLGITPQSLSRMRKNISHELP